jgi:hypothetical protein
VRTAAIRMKRENVAKQAQQEVVDFPQLKLMTLGESWSTMFLATQDSVFTFGVDRVGCCMGCFFLPALLPVGNQMSHFYFMMLYLCFFCEMVVKAKGFSLPGCDVSMGQWLPTWSDTWSCPRRLKFLAILL